MSKNLTITELRKQDKKFNEKIDVEVNGYSLKIDKYFRKTKINKLIAELQEKFEDAQLNDYRLQELIFPYVLLLVIKHFTSLHIPEELDEQLKVLDLLIDHDLFTDIINSIPRDQMELVYDEIAKVTEGLKQFTEEFEKMVLENPDILRDSNVKNIQ